MTTRNDLISALNEVSYDKRSVIEIIKNCPEVVDVLISAKDNKGEDLFKAIEVDDILYNCRNLKSFNKEAMSEILSNPDNVEQISQQNNRAYAFGRMLGYAYSAIRRENNSYGREGKTTTRNDLISALNEVSYDKRSVIEIIKNCPEVVDVLISAKDNKGEDLFKAIEVDDILYNCRNLKSFNKEAMSEILSNPDNVEQISQQKNRAYAFGQMLGYAYSVNGPELSMQEIFNRMQRKI